MRYSIEDTELANLRNFYESSNTILKNTYRNYISHLEEWSKKSNSELVYKICKYTLSLLDMDYNREVESFSNEFMLSEASFVGISRFYRIGQEGLDKVQKFQINLLPQGLLNSGWEFPNTEKDNVQYNYELINEYKDLTDEFFSKVQDLYNKQVAECNEKIDSNILWSSVKIIIETQYRTLLIFQGVYNSLFERFLDWYKEMLKKNEILLKEKESEIKKISNEMNEVLDHFIQDLLIDILQSSEPLVSQGENSPRVNHSNTSEQPLNQDEALQQDVQDLANEAIENQLKDLEKDLDTLKKKIAFIDGLSQCKKKLDDYFREKDLPEYWEKAKRKLHSIGDFIKKYRTPILKSMKILAPILASVVSPEGSLIYKLLKHLPDIIDCTTDDKPKEDDLKKLALGLEFMKILFGDNSGISGNSQTLVLSNPDMVGKQILKTILIHDDYRELFNIQNGDFNSPKDRALYQSLTGKSLPQVPSSRREHFLPPTGYNRHQMNDFSPQLTRKKLNDTLELVKDLDIGHNLVNRSPFKSRQSKGFEDFEHQESLLEPANSFSRGKKNLDTKSLIPETSEELLSNSEDSKSVFLNGMNHFHRNETSHRGKRDESLDQDTKRNRIKKEGDSLFISRDGPSEDLRREIENVKAQLDSGKGYVDVKPNTGLGALLKDVQTIPIASDKGSLLPHTDNRYPAEDMEVLYEEIAGEYDNYPRPNLGRALQNFVRRQAGYPAEYSQPTVKSVNELIPLVDDRSPCFSVGDSELQKMLQNASGFNNSENSTLKKSLLLNSSSHFILGQTSYLALGVLLMATPVWPVGLALSGLSIVALLRDKEIHAYMSLVCNIGQDRTDNLLASYQENEEGNFERVTEA